MEIILVDQVNFDKALWVYTEAWRESHREICTHEFLKKRDYEGYLRKKLGKLFLLVDEVPVGVFYVDNGTLEDLYIHPDHQRKGYGRSCVEFTKSRWNTVRLTVLSSNQAAISLYTKMGFRFTGVDTLLRNGLLEREMIYMEKTHG